MAHVAGLTRVPAKRSAWVDLCVFGLVAGLLGGLLAVGRRWAAPFVAVAPIDLSLTALPVYAGLSLARGVVAYVVSLAFTLAVGTLAGRSRRFERVILPALDILQSIPVLSFLPGFSLALLALFPGSNTGLELACVLAIFTGQVWNMTFSYHASLRRIPAELDEVARLHGVAGWRRFRLLELPTATAGLVWNSMMSMAGGWFFLSVVEQFQLGPGRAYRLPGLGSYMVEAIAAHDVRAMTGAVVAMVAVIVIVDRIVWRPLLCWSERFRSDDTAGAAPSRSFVYDMLRRSRVVAWIGRRSAARPSSVTLSDLGPEPVEAGFRWSSLVLWAAAAAGLAALAWGAWRLAGMLAELGAAAWLAVVLGLAKTSLRVVLCLAIGALWTVPVGIALGRSERLSRWALPLVQIVASFPAPMVFPLIAVALLRAGAGQNGTAIALMLLGSQWYLLFNAAAGAASVPNDLREAAVAFELTGMRRFVRLWLAGAAPALLTGLLTAAGGAWNASIVCELVSYPGGRLRVDGVGSRIAEASAVGDEASLAAATIAMMAAVVALNRLVWQPLQHAAARRFAVNR